MDQVGVGVSDSIRSQGTASLGSHVKTSFLKEFYGNGCLQNHLNKHVLTKNITEDNYVHIETSFMIFTLILI
jgi:hypothetical protein